MMPDLKLEDCIKHILSDTTRALSNALGRAFQENNIDLTTDQWSALVSLWNKDGQCQFELAKCQGKDRASITRLIDNMEKHNWVLRVPSEKDRRIKLVYLTPKAKFAKEKLLKLADDTFSYAIRDININDLETTKTVLKRIKDNLVSE